MMLLKDLLSKKVIEDLNNIKTDKKNSKTNVKGNRNKNKNKKDNSKVLNENKETVSVKHKVEDLDLTSKNKKHYITECPYCSSEDLSITGNGYYYCEECGIKVDKIFQY